MRNPWQMFQKDIPSKRRIKDKLWAGKSVTYDEVCYYVWCKKEIPDLEIDRVAKTVKGVADQIEARGAK